ncbi:MAG: hypothetical protein D6B26_03945, partial [Spirochaetaceae bacterium]
MMNETDPMDVFREEAQEILAEFEQTLINLEQSPSEHALVDSAFRNLHTLKGAASMFGFSALVEVTHLLEALFEQVRDSGAPATADVIEVALGSRDEISRLVQGALEGDSDQQANASITAAITRLIEGGGGKNPVVQQQPGSDGPAAGVTRTFRIEYAPHPDVFRNGGNPIALLKDLQDAGNALVIGFCREIPQLDQFDPDTCYLGWEILLTTDKAEADIRDIFLFAQDSRRLEILVIDGDDFADSDVAYKRLGELLVERGDLQPDQLESVMG